MGRPRQWQEVSPRGPTLRALCFGNENYSSTQFSKLPSAVQDAESVKKAVEEMPDGIAQVHMNLADKQAMEGALADFLGKAFERPPRMLLFYVSGHGVQTGEQLYLVPTGASPSNRQQLSEQCLSHGEIFLTFKDWVHKVNIEDVICVLIIDACRSQLDGSVHEDSFPPTLEPQGGKRPKLWALCVAAARNKSAYAPTTSEVSAFTRHLISEECGLFQPTVPVKEALQLVCERVRTDPSVQSKYRQEPTILGLELIPDICLWPETPATQQYDVYLCYHEDDKLLARSIRDQLCLTRQCKIDIFLHAESGAGTIDLYKSSASC